MDSKSSKTEIVYKKIIVEGRVQGVGFRPFIFRLAKKYKINGSVSNVNGCVVIKATAEKDYYQNFFAEIKAGKPENCIIEKIEETDIHPENTSEFIIAESESGAGDLGDVNKNKTDGNVFISPDLAVCGECIGEIYDKNNRRFSHYFNSCVNCGVRFSVIMQTPYDRLNISMNKFKLCKNCSEEYKNPADGRFHAETICCEKCGPILKYNNLLGHEALKKAVEDLKEGKIIAVKGVGGYHFACSPYDEETVRTLRDIKGRDTKPFAVMFRDCEEVEKICAVSDEEKTALISKERPIVILDLLNSKETPNIIEHGNKFAKETLSGDNRCGCLLPYTPLHELIMREIPALVMTSANISGSAIIYKDEEMCGEVGAWEWDYTKKMKFGGILSNDREIIRSVEDSVVQVNNGIQILRRSRGYVPAPFRIKSTRSFAAFGGDLKSAFALAVNGYAYPSQYFGDLEEKSVYERFTDSVRDIQNLFDISPEFVMCDAHPDYFSKRYAREYAGKHGIPVYEVQHHHAHAASVIAEHEICERVIGVIFDGTGYGSDGKIWGGEFLICDGGECRRAGHMNYTKLIGGDNISLDAAKTALCYLIKHGLDSFDCRRKAGRVSGINSEIIKIALEKNINCIESSSMGRFFDAVSAILGICGRNNYEGECAIALQREAERAVSHMEYEKMAFDIGYIDDGNKFVFDGGKILEKLINSSGQICELALGFHIAVAEMINEICLRIRSKEIAKTDTAVLSGGVFQNRLLTSLTKEILEKSGFRVYTNKRIAPNDNGIALGQAYLAEYLRC